MDPNLKAAAQKELLRRKAMAEMERRRATQPQQQVGYGEDMLKGAGVGLGEGAISLLGMPGDAAALSERAAQGGAEYLGAPDWLSKGAGKVARYATGPFANMPTSEQMTGAVEDVTGPFYKPQTVPGQYAQTVGQFAPTAAAGPGGIARKAAMTAIPALASETAGQMSKGEDYEPYARIGGALAGGLAAAGGRGGAMKQLRKDAPDLSTVGQQTDAAYARLREAGIQYDQNAYRSFVMKTVAAVRKHGWRPRDGDPITGDLQEIVGRLGKPNDFAEMENLRQFVGNLPKTASNADMARAGIIRDALSDFIDNGKVISTKGVDPADIAAMTKEARELGRRNILGKKIAQMGDKSQWYLGGEESGLRNQVASFAKQQGKSLTPVERAAFQKVVRREGPLNVLHTTGGRIGQTVLGGTALLAPGGGILPALGAMGLNLAARKGSEAITKKAVNDALKTVLAGRPAQAAATKSGDKARIDAMTRLLLAMEASSQEPFMTDSKGNQYPYPSSGQ